MGWLGLGLAMDRGAGPWGSTVPGLMDPGVPRVASPAPLAMARPWLGQATAEF